MKAKNYLNHLYMSESKKEISTKRRNDLDWMKLFAILCVILYHAGIFSDSRMIGAFLSLGIPMFFAVNGYLMLSKKNELVYFIKKNIRVASLIVFWGLVSSAIVMVCNGETLSLIDVVRHLVSLDCPHCHYLWFLCSIFSLNCISPIMCSFLHMKSTHTSKDSRNMYYLFALFFFWVMLRQFTWLFTFLTPWWGSFAVVYYIMGYIILGREMFNYNKLVLVLIVILGCVFQAVSSMMYNEGLLFGWITKILLLVNRSDDGYGYWTIGVFVAVSMSLALFRHFDRPLPPVCSFMAKNTLGLYLVSGPINTAMLMLYPDIVKLNILFPLVVLLSSSIIVYIVKRTPLLCELLKI